MSIIIGNATLDLSGGTVVIDTSKIAGFAAVKAVRLTNYTPDVLILTNINTEDPGQELLFPLQQMVYPTVNIQALPTILGQQLGSAFNVNALYVEWSTDPDNDFLGTYPVFVTQVPLSIPSVGNPSSLVASQLPVDDVTVASYGPFATRVDATFLNISASGQVIYLGGTSPGAAVSIDNGFPLAVGSSITLGVTGRQYFISSAAGGVLAIAEQRL